MEERGPNGAFPGLPGLLWPPWSPLASEAKEAMEGPESIIGEATIFRKITKIAKRRGIRILVGFPDGLPRFTLNVFGGGRPENGFAKDLKGDPY